MNGLNLFRASSRMLRPIRTALRAVSLVLVFSSVPTIAMAYVGPGAGLTMLGALGAVILAVVFAVVGLVLWPLRRMRRKRKASGAASEPATATVEVNTPADKPAEGSPPPKH